MKLTLVCANNIMTVMGGPDGSHERRAWLTVGKEYDIVYGMDGVSSSHYRVTDDNGDTGEFPKYLFHVRIQDLELSKDGWWKEIDALMDKEILPMQLGGDLKSLVSATLNKAICSPARDYVVQYAKNTFPFGITVDGVSYDIAVFVPDDKENGCQFFTLVRRWPGGTVRRVAEM